MQARWLVVTGASGTGKTAAVEALQARRHPWLRCYFFDTIGVPSAAAMSRDHGGGEQWQQDATRRWIERLAVEDHDGVVVLEGQTRLSYVRSALEDAGRSDTTMVLFEASAPVRRRRLALRGQADLANDRMESWAQYLRAEASAFGVRVIDTSERTVNELADELEAIARGREPAPGSSAGSDRGGR